MRGTWGFKLPRRPAREGARDAGRESGRPAERSRWYCRAHKDLGEAWLAARTGRADGPAEAPPQVPKAPKQARFL